MDPFDNLTSKNIILFSIKAYDRPNAVFSEFEGDFKRLKYVKRLIRKYKTSNDLKERLILNHIICLSNVFGVEATTKLLFFSLDSKDYDVLKTFLLFLNYLPDIIYGIDGINITVSNISVDLKVADKLRKI